MSAHQMARMAELENQAFSLMGRLHVVLRRETGRITDVEYMRIDPAYCRHLIQIALQSDHADLQKIGERLDAIYFGEDGLFVVAPPQPPLLARLGAGMHPAPTAKVNAASASPTTSSFNTAADTEASPPAQPDSDQHYVGRLR